MTDRQQLLREVKAYGMDESAVKDLSTADLDRAIQNRVGADMRNGVCSICKKGMHGGHCHRQK